MANNGLFKVVYSGDVRKHLHALTMLAHELETFLSSLVAIDKRLRNDPRVFGESLYSLPAAHLDVRLGAINPLAVIYGVRQEQPLVFISQFRLMGH